MRYLENSHDPNDKNAKRYVIAEIDQTIEDAWESHKRYLADKIIGLPQATKHYTVEELVGMGMVGIYTDKCKTCNKSHEKTYGENNEWCENCVPY